MIKTREKHVILVTLHDKDVTTFNKEMYPDRPECWDSPFDVDIDDIYRLEKTEEGKAIIWIPRDDEGGGMSVEVLEDYDELYDVITSKSELVKRRIGKDVVFHEVYLDGVSYVKRNDSKVVAKKITIGREISLSEMADIASGRR